MASSSNYGDSKFNLAAAGQAPARLDVQGDRPDGRAAARAWTSTRPRYVSKSAELHRPGDRGADRRPRRPTGHESSGPRRCSRRRCCLRQHGLPAARPRPRPQDGHPDRARHGHHQPPRRLPGRGAGRPDLRRLAAGDGARLRDDQRRRQAHQADLDHQGRLPRRPRRHLAEPPPDQEGLHRRPDLRGHPGDEGQRRSAAPAPAPTSAARRPARPAPPTTSPTPGSTA